MSATCQFPEPGRRKCVSKTEPTVEEMGEGCKAGVVHEVWAVMGQRRDALPKKGRLGGCFTTTRVHCTCDNLEEVEYAETMELCRHQETTKCK